MVGVILLVGEYIGDRNGGIPSMHGILNRQTRSHIIVE